MRFSKILLLVGFFIFANNIAFAQYDDDDQAQTKKGSQKREKVSTPKLKQGSGVKNSKSRSDLFKSSVNKTTHLSKKEQSKIISKKQATKAKRYSKSRGELQNKGTVSRMKKNERQSYRINSGTNAPFLRRVQMFINPTNSAIKRKSNKKSSALQKRQDDAREKYDTKYSPVSSKKKKKTKLRTFYNPFKKK